jgi:hypothetical protein
MLLSGVASAENLWIKTPDARERPKHCNGVSSVHETAFGFNAIEGLR